MATVMGAKALGLENRLGTIEPGKKADLIVFRFDHPSVRPFTDPASLVVYSATGRDVVHVFVDGSPVVLDGKVSTMDEGRVLREAEKRLEAVLRKAGR
jgi:5-methylthioadenosine/S-adenosylhomocysteine deaminase